MICECCNIKHEGDFGSGRFCSVFCSRKFSSSKYTSISKTVNCISCGAEVSVDSRASDKRCKCDSCRKSPKYKRSKKVKIEKHETFCKYCGKVKKNKNVFCNNECSRKYSVKCKDEAIAKNNGVSGHNIKTIKRYLISIRGHRCIICGMEEWMGQKIPLVLDHINGRSSDHRLDNLRLVCGNCDMQLPTYKSKNKNSERTHRKKES